MPDDDDLIDAAPCPKCKAPLAIAAADLGYLIECPSCGAQSRARRAEGKDPPAGKSPPPPATDRTADPSPRRRNWDGDEERDRDDRDRDRDRDEDDRRPPPSRGRDRSRDMDRHDRDPRRGSRFREDFDDRPIRRPGQGAAVAAAVMNFIFAAVALIEGLCAGLGGSRVLVDGGRGGGGGPFGGPENAGLVFLGFGLCNLLGVGLMIPAGVGLLQRRDYGRTLGFLAAGMGLIYALSIVVLFLVVLSEERGPPPGAAIVVFIIPVMVWLAFAITNLILLGKVRPQSR